MANNWQRWALKAMRVANHPATVTDVVDVTTWYRRIHLHAPSLLAELELYPTVWIRLWVHDQDDPGRLHQRAYTLVDPDPEDGTFALEFVLHEPAGPATAWARDAVAGQVVEVAATPKPLHVDLSIPRWILAGDTAALPAINSLLQHLPSTADVHLQDSHPADERSQLPVARTDVAWHWLDPDPDRTAVADAIRATSLDPTATFLWACGERRLVRHVRTLVKDIHLPSDRHHTHNYWIARSASG